MKRTFSEPKMDIVFINAQDVLLTSGDQNGNDEGNLGW